MSDFWNSCLLQLEQELPSQQFSTWIVPLRFEPVAGSVDAYRLLVPNGFHQKWVKDRYLARIEAMGGEFFDRPISVTVAIAAKLAKPPVEVTDGEPGSSSRGGKARRSARRAKSGSG
jgi:chromosomal replication initiator protein